MEGLYEVSLEINAQSDLASLLQDITIRAARLLGAKASTLALMQPDGETLKFEIGHLPAGRTFKPTVRLGEGLIGQAAQMGKPLMVADYSRWPDRVPGIDWVGRALAAPLAMGEQVVGVITVFDTDKVGDFEAEEIRLLRLFAAQAAIAIEKARLLEAERRERLQAETLREVSLALNSQTDLAAVLDEILSQAGRLVPYRMAHIMLLKGNILTIARWRGYERSESAEVIPALKHTLDELPLDRQAIQSGQPVVVLDTRQEPDWVIFQETAWVRSCLIVPIRLRERVLGILRLDGATPGEFSLEDGTKLQPMVSAAAIALENVRLFEVVRVGRERLQRLSQRLVEAQESERRHIARELHDEIGQSLTALKLHLQNFQRRRDPARIQQGLDLVEETLQQVRNLSLDLRPSLLDELGLAEALRWYLNRQAEIAGFKTTLTLEPIETPLPLGLETTCFRIVQEALTNIIKHAAARQVYLELCQRGSELWLTIADDGGGFDVAAALQRAALGESLGLLNMEERVTLLGGQIEIDSDPGRGARIQVRFPL
jgi:signal transduction histidine kinase